MKKISLTIMKNDNLKLSATIEEEKSKHRKRMNRAEQDLDAINIHIRNLSRDTINEESNLRKEQFLESKLKLEKFKSEERIQQHKNESKSLRNKTIALEWAYQPILYDLEDKIESQNETIKKCKTDFSKLSKGNEILLKILAKQKGILDALLKYNEKKTKEMWKLHYTEKNQERKRSRRALEPNSLNSEYFSVVPDRTLAVAHLRSLSKTPVPKKTTKIIECIKTIDDEIWTLRSELDLSELRTARMSPIEPRLETYLQQKSKIEDKMKKVIFEVEKGDLELCRGFVEIRQAYETAHEQSIDISKISESIQEAKAKLSDCNTTIHAKFEEVKSMNSKIANTQTRLQQTNNEIKELTAEASSKEQRIIEVQSRLKESNLKAIKTTPKRPKEK